jgi:hypothetical protein
LPLQFPVRGTEGVQGRAPWPSLTGAPAQCRTEDPTGSTERDLRRRAGEAGSSPRRVNKEPTKPEEPPMASSPAPGPTSRRPACPVLHASSPRPASPLSPSSSPSTGFLPTSTRPIFFRPRRQHRPATPPVSATPRTLQGLHPHVGPDPPPEAGPLEATLPRPKPHGPESEEQHTAPHTPFGSKRVPDRSRPSADSLRGHTRLIASQFSATSRTSPTTTPTRSPRSRRSTCRPPPATLR